MLGGAKEMCEEVLPNLLIYVTGDFTRGKSGSHIRFAQMIELAITRFHNVIVYSYRSNAQDPWTKEGENRFRLRFPAAKLVLEDQTSALKLLVRIKNFALMLAPGRAKSILGWRLPGQTPGYDKAIASAPQVALLVNFIDGLTELNGVDVADVLVDTHDCKFIRYAKYRGLKLFACKSLARLRSEIGVLDRVKAIIAISAVEAGFFRAVLSDRTVLLVPVYSDAPKVATRDIKKDVDLLFVGSNNPYNRNGLKAFLRDHAALLEDVTLDIAGSVCEDDELVAIAGCCRGARLLGWVDDLTSVYARAKAVIAPVDGSGLNIKVVEALEHGKPVFASAHARDSLPAGCDHCVLPIDERLIRRVVADQAWRHDLEQAALSYSCGPWLRGDRNHVMELLANTPAVANQRRRAEQNTEIAS
jgi:glycosyltransferase involved in cell wall biosynthesis